MLKESLPWACALDAGRASRVKTAMAQATVQNL
jgi:hypothetical protein